MQPLTTVSRNGLIREQRLLDLLGFA